ncbi:MAG: FAD-dependent oxidoreductase, partial [Pseudomonadota bacterium]
MSIPYADALRRLDPGAAPVLRAGLPAAAELLAEFHPDQRHGAVAALRVGVNRGQSCRRELADLLEANALIDDLDLAGAESAETDVLVIGGGGAGAAAALQAARGGARVTLACKLRLGDSNTVMAEGGIQASLGADDSPQRHFEDTLRGGHFDGERGLIAQMVGDAPGLVRWLIEQGVQFDRSADGSGLLRKRGGGCSAARVLSHGDFTGLELMRVLREAVELQPGVAVLNRCPAVELLSHSDGSCAGAVLYDLERERFLLLRARSVILATGGSGRLHLAGFATSNHYGATADGLVLAYRMGARLRELDSFQFHPTGLAYPAHLAGSLVSEAARANGALLLNGEGQRFVDELAPRDVVSAAILRECAQGRGVERDGCLGVLLDTPRLAAARPGCLQRELSSLAHLAAKTGDDPAAAPLLVHPTLHYQNGGVAIDGDGASDVAGLYCVGELAGGIHGRNRLMGNALLDVLSFGRRAGAHAAAAAL